MPSRIPSIPALAVMTALAAPNAACLGPKPKPPAFDPLRYSSLQVPPNAVRIEAPDFDADNDTPAIDSWADIHRVIIGADGDCGRKGIVCMMQGDPDDPKFDRPSSMMVADTRNPVCTGDVPVVVPGVDSDDDGLTDQFEEKSSYTDPENEDTDGDGFSDGHEYGADSDPHDPDSKPESFEDHDYNDPVEATYANPNAANGVRIVEGGDMGQGRARVELVRACYGAPIKTVGYVTLNDGVASSPLTYPFDLAGRLRNSIENADGPADITINKVSRDKPGRSTEVVASRTTECVIPVANKGFHHPGKPDPVKCEPFWGRATRDPSYARQRQEARQEEWREQRRDSWQYRMQRR